MKVCMFAPLKTNMLSFPGCGVLSPNTECLNSDLCIRHSRFRVTCAISVQRFVEVALKGMCLNHSSICFIFKIEIDYLMATFV